MIRENCNLLLGFNWVGHPHLIFPDKTKEMQHAVVALVV